MFFYCQLFGTRQNYITFALPFLGDIMIDLWCSGSTADFGSVSLGSSPGRSTGYKLI